MPRSQLRLPLAAVFIALVAVRHRPAGSWARRRLVAGLRSAAPQALSLPPPHPLSFLRRRLVGVSMRSSHCRKGTGLPPAPQLRGPRSTTSPRSPASSSSWTRLVCRPRLAPAPPLTQHRSCAHPWQAPRPRDGRCRSWLTRYAHTPGESMRHVRPHEVLRTHKTISNAWVAAGGARLLQARQFPRAVSASASVAHRTNEKISWRPCKCLYVLCLVCHMFCDVWLVIFWLCLDGFKRKNLNLDFARYSCRTQKAGGARPTGRYID